MSIRPLKWTREEDEKLILGVKKYGTSWTQIQAEFCQGRSKNAIVKRWHGKLKDLNGNLDLIHHINSQQQSDKNYTKKSTRIDELSQKEIKEQSENIKIIENTGKFNHQWTINDDNTLKQLVLKQQEYDWYKLSKVFNTTIEDVIRRWQKKIYPQLKLSTKIAGALKWSVQEDSILIGSQKFFGSKWKQILVFLPSRSSYSIEGRWKRLIRGDVADNTIIQNEIYSHKTKEISMNKYEYRKYVIKKIAQKYEKKELPINNIGMDIQQ